MPSDLAENRKKHQKLLILTVAAMVGVVAVATVLAVPSHNTQIMSFLSFLAVKHLMVEH